jgi:hypothetical protein
MLNNRTALREGVVFVLDRPLTFCIRSAVAEDYNEH